MQPFVTIHLLTYNGERFVEECLEAVFGQTYPAVEVLVTDNASTDGTFAKLKSKKLENQRFYSRSPSPQASGRSEKLKIFKQKTNLGFAAGHNFGIKQSKGEYILCLSQDVVLDKDFVKYAVEAMESDAKIGAVQGKLLQNQKPKTKNQKLIDTVGLQPLKSRRFVNRGQGESDEGQYEKLEEIFGADGAVPLYRRAALEDVKLPINYSLLTTHYKLEYEYFDEDFFLYKEDIDLAWRLKLAGWKAVYQSRAIAWHARTAGSAISIAKARQALPFYAKYHSFKNQRFLLLKNDAPWYFMKHLPWALPYEIVSWLWVIFFEPKSWGAIGEVFRLLPNMLRKRHVIMARRRVAFGELYPWFL